MILPCRVMIDHMNSLRCCLSCNLVPRVRFSFCQRQEHGLWPHPGQEVRKSRTSCSSAHAQKFETTEVVNSYKNGSSLLLPISWKCPESMFLVVTKRKADSWYEIAFHGKRFGKFCITVKRKKSSDSQEIGRTGKETRGLDGTSSARKERGDKIRQIGFLPLTLEFLKS